MKILFTAFLAFIFITIKAQNLPDNFNIGNILEVYSNDSILFNFKCTGSLINIKCADFIRKGKIDSININVTGKFTDYFVNGKKAFMGIMKNDFLNGKTTKFHRNGNIEAEGYYKDGIKRGIWRYYYSNGDIKKVINFIHGYPLVIEFYDKNGEITIKNGNGIYMDRFHNYKSCDYFQIKGSIRNGRMNGKWDWYSSANIKIGSEYFENGIFIKGESKDYIYKDQQKIYIEGFNVHENIENYDNSFSGISCDKIDKIYIINNGKDLHNEFLPALLEPLQKFINNTTKNQWIICGIRINKKIIDVKVKSSINDTELENKIYNLLENQNNWNTSPRQNQIKKFYDIYFAIPKRGNQIVIPTEIIRGNKKNKQKSNESIK